MFSNFLKAIQNDLGTGLLANKKPTVVTNLMIGNKWNQNLPKFGGEMKPYQPKPVTMPDGTVKVLVNQPKQQPTPVKQAVLSASTAKKYAPSTTNISQSLQSGGLNLKGVKPMPTNSPTPTPTPKYTPSDMTDYEKLTRETFNKYGIPEAVAFGIAAAENGSRNRFNIGAIDSNPNNAMIQDDLSNATAAAKMLSGQAEPSFYGNGEAGRQAFANAYSQRNDPAKMLQLIRDAGYAGDRNTWVQRSRQSPNGAGWIYNSWDEFIKNTPGYRKWIK